MIKKIYILLFRYYRIAVRCSSSIIFFPFILFYRNRINRVRKCNLLFPVENPYSLTWIYHSENWDKVKYRFAHRNKLRKGLSLNVLDAHEPIPSFLKFDRSLSDLSIDTMTDGKDKWVYLYLNPAEYIWRNYTINFECTRNSDFRELQFGFRYNDFYNRYRVRHESGYFYIDKVLNGRFYNGLRRRKFVMEVNKYYNFTISCIDAYFTFYVDNEIILEYYDITKSFNRGSFAMIFWEDDRKTPIQCNIKNLQIHELC